MLTYLAFINHFKKKKKIFSNYNFYGFPFTKIDSLPNLDQMREGFFAGDELWLWVDSRATRDKRNQVVSSILLKSRKRDITIAYTSKNLHQVDKRIKDITDFVAYPMMSPDNSFCRVEIFHGSKPSISSRMKPPMYFLVEPVISMFNTYEEIQNIAVPDEDEAPAQTVYEEKTIPIHLNPAWVKYLREKGITSNMHILRYSEKIQSIIETGQLT